MYLPQFEGPIEGYVVNFLTKNYWRVERTQTWEDAKQEAYIVFLRVAGKYAGAIETPQHFMALFKTAWFNHFTNLTNADTESRIFVQPERRLDENGQEITMETQGDSDNDGYLSVLLAQAPREISMVLNLFLNAPQEVLDVALAGWHGRGDRRRKNGDSVRICQLLGLPKDRDVMAEVKEYFRHS